MIRQLRISNFKSVIKETIPLGRFTVIIGENGAGKSNILEALVMASAASNGKLERELLIGRGIRVPPPDLMRSAFSSAQKNNPIEISLSIDSDFDNQQEISFSITHDGKEYSDWTVKNPEQNLTKNQFKYLMNKKMSALTEEAQTKERSIFMRETVKLLEMLREGLDDSAKEYNQKKPIKIESSLLSLAFKNFTENKNIEKFTVYAPEYYTLRNFVAEGQTAPLGTRGEGLLKLLATMHEKENDRFQAVNDGLKILGWYQGIDTKSLAKSSSENRIHVKDRFIKRRGIFLDQISTNEGFLFCLFFLTLFASSQTPDAFAIENIETGLNPKLSEALTKILKELGAKYGKQAIVSSHSPSVLDALNLDNPNEILLAVDRNLDGHTRVTKINKPRTAAGKTTRLSELFLKGLIGGVPKNFL